MEADRDPRYREEHVNGVDSWIKYLDMDVQGCGGRLVVHDFQTWNLVAIESPPISRDAWAHGSDYTSSLGYDQSANSIDFAERFTSRIIAISQLPPFSGRSTLEM